MTPDELAFAQSIANSIKHDKAADAFIAADESLRVDFVHAYADQACKKMRSFTSTYNTNCEARDLFRKMVLMELQGDT